MLFFMFFTNGPNILPEFSTRRFERGEVRVRPWLASNDVSREVNLDRYGRMLYIFDNVNGGTQAIRQTSKQ